MRNFIIRSFNKSIHLPRKRTLLGLFLGISMALPVSILFLVTAPQTTIAQSTNPWNLYNNPTYGNSLDASLGPSTVDPPPLRLHSNGNMMLRTNLILGPSNSGAINSQTFASISKGLIFNSATTPWWVRGNSSDTQLAFGSSTDASDANINFSINSTGGINLPKTGSVVSFPAFSGNYTQSQGITAGPNGNMIDGVPWYMSFSREPGNWPNANGTYPNLVINNHTGVRLTAHGSFAMGGISFYEQLGPDFNWSTATSKGTEIARFRISNYGGSYVNSNFGIGITNPLGKLHVGGLNDGDGLMTYSPANDTLALQTTLNSQPNNGYGGDENRLILQPVAGRVGIGTNTPQGKLSVGFGNGDQLIVYQPYDDALAIQTTLNAQPNNGYGGDPPNRLMLQPVTGFVSIGHTNPQGKLDILAGGDDTTPAIRMRQSNAAPYGYDMGIDNNVDGGLYFHRVNNGTQALTMDLRRDTGWVGLKTIPYSDLHIKQSSNGQGQGGIRLERSDNGNFGVLLYGGDDRTYIFGANNGAWCALNTNSTWGCASDRRLKSNIKPLENSALALIRKLKPSEFDYIANGTHGAGFIAQDVQEVLPEAVNSNTQGFLSVSDSYFTPYLVKSLQELDGKFNQFSNNTQETAETVKLLTEQIQNQQQQIDELKMQIELLKK